jgi:hypothetical protein
MRPPDEVKARQEAELDEAEEDIASGDLDEARAHVAEAAELGASRRDITRLSRAVATEAKARDRRARRSRWMGAGVSIAAYAVLSFHQPHEWGQLTWVVLALVVVPGVVGWLIGRAHGPGSPRGLRFRRSLAPAAAPMALYTAIWLMVLRSRIGSGGSSGEVFLVGVFVTAVYAGVAACVAGGAAAVACRGPREATP